MANGILTVTEVRKLAKGRDGKHRVAPSLYLRVQGASCIWSVRVMANGKAREISLGPIQKLSLVEAIAKAAELRVRARNGEEIITRGPTECEPETRETPGRSDKFRDVAEQLIASMRAGWKNQEKHGRQWANSLATYAYPKLGDMSVADITTHDVLDALTSEVEVRTTAGRTKRGPFWSMKYETATRVRERIEAVLSAAKARGLRSGENPAAWKDNLKALLPKIDERGRVRHHPAMPWKELPAFMTELKQRDSMSSRALQFTILSACRTNEVTGARWTEVDLTAGLWTIPAIRMKTKREHRVPLSAAAVQLLAQIPSMEDTDVVFWGGRLRKPRDGVAAGAVGPLSNMAMLELLRGMRPRLTVHGFRSTFRDWAAEATSFPAEVVEMALAHTIQNQVEAAYRRGDLLGKRRDLMQAWADYALGATSATS